MGHAEEIQRSLSVVQRSGSLGWQGSDDRFVIETRKRLEEDFKHLVDQTDLLWQTREKMAATRRQKAETRWSALTNTFTYLYASLPFFYTVPANPSHRFAPVTIISGIYGMNVAQISGSNTNPGIWQFFVAVAILNILIVLFLAALSWFHTLTKHGRKAGAKEVFGFAMGNTGK